MSLFCLTQAKAYVVGDTLVRKAEPYLEQGSPIDNVLTPEFTPYSVYDADGDGVMEPSRYDRQWREPNGRMMAESAGYLYGIEDGEAVSLLPRFDSNHTVIADLDNDGLTDMGVYYDSGTSTADGRSWKGPVIFTQQADGSFVTGTPTFVKEEAKSRQGDGITWTAFLQGFLRNGMFAGEDPNAAATGSYNKLLQAAADLNNDGTLDCSTSEGLFFSQNDGSIFFKKNRESVYPCDIDGDGVVDYVCYDGTALYVVTDLLGTEVTRRELYKNTKIDNVLFRDFDHDGDIDIMVFLCINENSYFVFLRNNGDGTFRRKEVNFSNSDFELTGMGDYDADGCYELLLRKKNSYNSYEVLLMKVNADFTMTRMEDKFVTDSGLYSQMSSNNNYDVILGDFNNDGLTEFYSYSGILYGHLSSQTQANTRPARMAMPTAILMPETNRLKINWQQGTDAETSACDLTYELRIGTQPGLGDVLRAESMEDGKRLTTRAGKHGTMLQTLFNAASLKPGKYYIAVQAIDQGGLGGEFSEELVYEHELQTPVFEVSTHSLSTADTLHVYVKASIPDAVYCWTTTEGEVIGQTDIGADIMFHQQGYHEVGLTVTVDGMTYQAAPQAIYVSSMKHADLLKGDSYYTEQALFDWNQDGYIDYFAEGDGRRVYKNNGDGTFSQVLLSTFADWTNKSYVRGILDFNRDGFPDMVVENNAKGDVYLNYGEQDFDFDYQSTGINIPDNSNIFNGLIDLNNDGLMDCDALQMVTNGNWYDTYVPGNDYTTTYCTTNGVDYEKTVILPSHTSYYYNPTFYDVNRDGFPDLVYMEHKEHSDHGDKTLNVCYKDSTQGFTYSTPHVLFRIPEKVCSNLKEYDDRKYVLADFNNDGCADVAFVGYNIVDGKESDLAFFIMKGNPAGESSEVVVKIDGMNEYSLPVDMNNDGYLDIPHISYEKYSSHYENEHVFIGKPDFKFELQPYSDEEFYFWSQSRYIVPLSNQGDILFNGSTQKTTIQNQSPAAPSYVAVKQSRDGLLISWDDAQDDHTPAAQMRYNVSVKRKGRTGDGAFVISPMNGLRDEAAIVPSYAYKQSTQMLVPSTVLTVGETYEIQVQAIDLWGAHSPMTQPVEFTMGAGGYIEADDRIAVDTETFIALRAAQADSYSIDLGEGGMVVKDYGGGLYSVKWATTGVKGYTITAGTTSMSGTMSVVARTDVSFQVPELVLAGAPLAIPVSDEMARLSANVGFSCSGARVDYVPGSSFATVEFPSAGTYELTSYYEDDVCGNSFTQTVNVSETMPEADIARVDVDEKSRYFVSWDDLPSYISKVVVYKESAVSAWFAPLDTVDAATGYYIDASSNALVNSSRYALKLLASNGQESEMGSPHLPLHVMLNYSPMGGYNLIWNAYQGLSVGSYVIWRGTDVDEMEPIDYVSGYQQSYTDLDVPDAACVYYFVSFIPMSDFAWSRSNGMKAPAWSEYVRSNIISTENAADIVSAKQIHIISAAEEQKLTEAQPSMQLYAIVLPAYATITRVAWSIVDGDDLASISSSGLLTAFGEGGSVTVRATTLDGTNLTAELTIPIEMAEGMKGDVNRDKMVDVADVVQTVNHILGRTPSVFAKRNADVNGDGEINVGDLVGMVGIIADGYSGIGAARSAPYAMVGQLSAVLTPDAAIVGLHNPQDFTAFQMLITLPEGTGKEQAELRLRSASDHVVMADWLSDRQMMVVVYSMNRHTFTTADNVLLQVVTDGALHGEWLFEDIVFARADGTTCKFDPLSLKQTSGISETIVLDGEGQRLFDLGGRPVMGKSPRRGLYINGNKKKIVR